MDGLECSEISYKNIISNNDVFRFDSEYFKKESVALINTIYNRNYDLIGNHFDVSKLAGFEYTKYFTEENMSSNNVYIAITSKNVKSERLLLDDVLTIDKTIADEYLGRSKLKPKDVVLSYTGEYRRALTLEINNVQLGPNVCRLTPKDNAINSYYLSSFLNCPVGQKILDKEKTLSAQPTVAMSRIRNIPIPLLSNKFQNIIEEIIRWANISILEADNKYSTAKAILFNELNYRPDEICRDSIAIKFLSQINTTDKRIDAEFYQPKYEQLLSILTSNAKYTKTIAELATYNARGIQPIYVENGKLDVINSKHILETSLDYGNFEKAELALWKDNPKARVFMYDILIYTTGANIGRTAAYLSDKKAIASNHVNILRLKKSINNIYVAFVINSQIGKLQIDRYSAGSAQQELYPKDIENIVIPFIDESQQQKISECILDSYKEKDIGLATIYLVQKAVSIAIKQNETEAIAWLKGKGIHWSVLKNMDYE